MLVSQIYFLSASSENWKLITCYLYLLSGKGWYMYIETSYPRRPNDTAGLVSPTIQTSSSSVCVLFWYHMFGPHVNALNVYTKVRNQNAVSKFCLICQANKPTILVRSLGTLHFCQHIVFLCTSPSLPSS